MTNKHFNRLTILAALIVILVVVFGMRNDNKLKLLTKLTLEQRFSGNAQKAIPRLAIIPQGDNPTFGTDTAAVEMIVYLDYECPYSIAFIKERLPLLFTEYVNSGILQVTFRDLPLGMHDNAIPLAYVAHNMDQYQEFGIFLSQLDNNYGEMSHLEIYNTFGIEDISDAERAVFDGRIEESIFLAGVAGITATPTVIVNSRMLEGLRTIDELRSIIDYNIENSIPIDPVEGACAE